MLEHFLLGIDMNFVHRLGFRTRTLVRFFSWSLVTLLLSQAGLASYGKGKPGRTDRIAIIGAGASGLTAAYIAQKMGYQNVVVFEREPEVGGIAKTLRVNGKVYDMSTMFVPGGSIEGDGIQPLLKEMIHVSREELVPAVGFDALGSDGRLSPLSEELKKYSQEELKRQLLEGLVLMSKYASCLAQNVDGVSCGIISEENPKEGIHEWGLRNEMPAFSHMIVYTSDALGAGPGSYLSAAQALAGGFRWTPVEAVRVLKFLDPDGALPEGLPENIVSLMTANHGKGAQRWWFFKNGYQNFWKNLAYYGGIQVQTANSVLSMVRKETGRGKVWWLNTRRGRRIFDKVIVATTPKTAMKFLPEGPSKELLKTAIARVPPNDVFLAMVSDFSGTGFPERSAWWSDGFGLGSLELVDPLKGGPVKPVFWQKRHGSNNVVLIGTYTLSPEITPDQAFDAVNDYAQRELGFTLTERLAHERFFFPASPSDREAWTQGWERLQGEDGLYFIGEAFTGSGIPAIASGLQKMIPQFLEPESH